MPTTHTYVPTPVFVALRTTEVAGKERKAGGKAGRCGTRRWLGGLVLVVLLEITTTRMATVKWKYAQWGALYRFVD